VKPKVKIKVTGLGDRFNPITNPLFKLLNTAFDFEFSDDPDFLLFSIYGEEHYQYQCTKIFYTLENWRPNFNLCDYAFSFRYLDRSDHYRLPYYALFEPYELEKHNYDCEQILASKTGFCSFVVSNANCEIRNRFYEKLSRYKKIDSGGRYLNNVGGRVADKQAFINKYKFNIAFENFSSYGYTTEKIADAMRAKSIPIYWGHQGITEEFNDNSFINYYNFDSEDDLIDYIIEVDRNDDLYLEMLSRPWLHNNRLPESLRPETVLQRFGEIFSAPLAKPRSKSVFFQANKIYEQGRQRLNDRVRDARIALGLKKPPKAA